MRIDRRGLIGGAGALGLLTASGKGGAQPGGAQAAAQPAPLPPAERIAAAALQHRHRLDHSAGRFSGPAWDLLVREGRAAHFFLIGEEHGIAQNPMLASALFTELAPSGYRRLAIETSAPMAAEMDRVLLAGGRPALQTFLREPGNAAAFFGMREEADLLAAVRAVVPASQPALWGVDYEVGADRRLIAMLRPVRKPAAAERALAALEAESTASWSRYEQTRGPQHLFSFGGDPALVGAVRAAWPNPDARSALILETLEETLQINRQFMAGDNFGSNQRRAQLLRRNFLRHWQAVEGPRAPRVMLKAGASHLIRGLSLTDVNDLGALVPEVAALHGRNSFSMLVLAGAGTQVAGFDPSRFSYVPAPTSALLPNIESLTAAAWPDAFTLIDLRPLRPLARGVGRRVADANLRRLIHGFDALLVMSGSTPSANL